jgi:ABC-type multidrug transport system fused ATPase/permease subunit
LHGKSGSGKSLLLAAIIGEAEIVSGRIYRPKVSPDNHLNDQLASSTNWIIPSATALVAQIPWIENTSLKSNILFGLPYIESRFSKVLEACALAKDLEILPDGVETEIGANGINLSGGQRWRITLARALYSRAGILILDDIFSAVDAHVSRHILLNALEGELGDGRTRILVTHHIQLVRPFASYVVELGTNGSIESSVVQLPSKVSKLQENLVPIEATGSDDLRDVSLAEPSLIKQEPKKFVEDEQREEGRVKWAVYRRYTRAFGGWIYGALTVGLFIFSSFTTLGRSYWVKVWAQHYEDIGPSELSTHSKTSLQMVDNHLNFYLGIYLLISIIAALSTAVKTIGVLSASIRASRKLFEDVTYNVLRAPLRWLDTVPVGRILNRFVSDFALVDSQLAGDFFWLAHGALGVITTVGAALFVSIYMIAPVLIVAFAALYFVNIYLDGARDIKRLEANAKSPIFEFFGSSVAGLATIRSFEKVDEYLERMFVLIDDYTRTSWYLLLVSRWMAFRQGALGVVFSLFVASLVVVIHGINASLAGFVLSFAMEYSNVAIMTVTQYADFELAMNSTERVVEYTEMLPEGQSGHSVAQSWPSKGRLVVKNLEVKYAPDLPLVLNGISFTVESCERVGVVGRTGSGKSSLTLSLFRFLQASSGSIEIDGVDISKIKLHDLRSRLAIIPQDPVLFSGTLRSNIDPFNQQCDSTIIDALKRVHLLDSGTDEVENSGLHHADQTVRGHDSEQTNVNIFRNLESPISRGGLNLSQGQRQLLCLARVIVKQPKIIVLDEATSSVDMQTDSLIQQSIREQFSNSTLLVIAHRLSTISDFDKVLVMSDGQVVEFDTPRDLMRKRAAFWELVNESGRERQ